MPVYEYKCEKCSTRFEEYVGIKEDNKKIECPKCRAEDVKKIMSSFLSLGGCSSSNNRFR